MFNQLKKSFIAIIIAAATLGAGAQTASAGGVTFEFRYGNHGHGPVVRINPRHHDRYFNPPSSRNYYCSPRKAVKKAHKKFGVKHAKIARANHRKIVVRGYKRGHRVKVVFANHRGCPVIARRAAW